MGVFILISNLTQLDNILTGTVNLESEEFYFLGQQVTKSYSFYNSVCLQLAVDEVICDKDVQYEYVYKSKVYIKFFKLDQDDNLSYVAKLTSKELAVDTEFTADTGTWHLVKERLQDDEEATYEFDLEVAVNIFAKPSSFAALYDDEELTDFELRGSDGSVSVHRAVLAACSPVLRRMLAGPWKEAKQGHVDISDNTQHTLQLLKEFVYLGKLPDVVLGLRALLLLAKCYMMTDLERLCLKQLGERMRSADVLDLMEFSIVNKLNKLTMIIFKNVKDNKVDLDCVEQQIENVKQVE